jgi:hypothetical protein
VWVICVGDRRAGIDMLYLGYRLTSIEYNETYKLLQAYLKKHFPSKLLHKKSSDTYITYAFSNQGFQEIRLVKNRFDYCAIEVRFRPQLVINEEGYYKLTSIPEFVDVSVGFNYVVQDILDLPVPEFHKWKIKRVEAAVDISVEPELIPLYLQLFKKGNIPSYFLEHKQTKEHWNSLTNVYLMASKVTVNWYNRYDTIKIKEMKSEKKSGKKFQDYFETKGILRFETQLRKCNEDVIDVLDQELMLKKVMVFYKLIVGQGDYYSLENAKAIISKSANNTREYLELTRLLILIEKHDSITNAKKVYAKGKNNKAALDKFSKLIIKLGKLGINPVVLPEDCGITYLENLYKRIEKG